MTFAEVLGRFLTERCPKRSIQPATMNMYRYFVRDFLVPALGDREVGELTHLDFEALYDRMLERGFDPSTIAKCHGTAHGAIHHAEREGWVGRNVVRLAEPPKRRPKDIHVPTPQDVQVFLASAVDLDPSLADFVRVQAATGMRPGEGCAIQPTDLDGHTLTIGRALDISCGKARIKSTKTGKVRRIVLDPKTIEVITRRGGLWVFGGDEPWRQDSIAHRFRIVRKVAGVHFTPRSLRHFHATQLLGSGKLSVRQVADRLGHSNPTMTLNVYSRFIPTLDVLAADVIADVLAS